MIKKTLDNIPRFVFWRIDDALVVIIPFSLGVLLGSLFFMGSGFVGAYIYRKFRKKNRHINVKGAFYWVFGSGFPKIPSYIRRIRK